MRHGSAREKLVHCKEPQYLVTYLPVLGTDDRRRNNDVVRRHYIIDSGQSVALCIRYSQSLR